MQVLSDRIQAVELIGGGSVGVLATDTVYGVVAGAGNQAAVERLYALKDRHGKPGTLIAANTQQLVDLGIPARYVRPVEQYWPNPISVVVPAPPELNYLHQAKGSIAVRIPADNAVHQLLLQTGPLLTSSANQPGEPTAITIQAAQAYFGDEVDYYADNGDLSDRQASTIIRVVDDAVEVLREGSIKINEAGEIV